MNAPHNLTVEGASLQALQQLHAEATANLEKAQAELEELHLQSIGYSLMMWAGQAAVRAGKAKGMGLFEQYEAAKETQKVRRDLQALAYIWPLAKSPAELQRDIELLNLKTLTGTLAAVRLVKYYDEVLAHEFEQMEEPARRYM